MRSDEGKGDTFVGRAVVYDSWSEKLYGYFKERIAPGAFDECLEQERDIIATIDHDTRMLIGRTSAGTLRLKPGKEGIDAEVDAADYSYARDLATAIRRGDMRGMSFTFDVLDDEWQRKDGDPVRIVTRANIYEVAFVYTPAYPDTTAGIRGIPLGLFPDGEQRAIERAKRPPLSLLRSRLRLAELN